MARTTEEIIKVQLGSLLAEVAVLTSRVELLMEDNERLRKQLETKEKD